MPQLALLLTTFVWGATFPATKAALEQISPLSFLFLRFFVGMIIVLAVLLLARRKLAMDAVTVRVSLIATGWLFLGYVLQTVGLRFTTASNSAFITVLYVVFVPLYLRRLGLHTWVSNGIALFGLWFLVRPTASANLGDLLTLGSAAAFAAHMVCLERYTRMADPVSLFAWQLLFMSLAMLGTMWWEHPTASMFERLASWSSVWWSPEFWRQERSPSKCGRSGFFPPSKWHCCLPQNRPSQHGWPGISLAKPLMRRDGLAAP